MICRKTSLGVFLIQSLLKAALIFGVLIVLALIVYRALRPYLKLVRQFLQAVRYFQQPIHRTTSSRQEGEKLVKCAACDTWVPESRALHGNMSDYCSRACLEGTGRRARKAG
jgi:hypothetical protein